MLLDMPSAEADRYSEDQCAPEPEIRWEVRICMSSEEASAKAASSSSFCFTGSLQVVFAGPALVLAGGTTLCQRKPRMCTLAGPAFS